MGYELIITEKPKQAMRIAYALADGKPVVKREFGVNYFEAKNSGKAIVIAPAVGHIFTLKEVSKGWEYPVFDIEWRPIYEVDKKAVYTKKYHSLLTKVAKNATSVTISCDYDIEGELIGWNVLRFICKTKKASRMKFSTLTQQELQKAYKEKSDSINLPQAEAGETRHFLDWFYGINVSRALTTALKQSGTFKILSSGRVQGPALKIIADRERGIKSFKPEPYWRLEYKGQLNGDMINAFHKEDKFWKKQKAEVILKKCDQKDAKIAEFESKEYEQYAPHPFDLTTLQIEAHRWLRVSPQITLNHAQTLYLGGFISYPRTSSQKLPFQLGFKKIITALASNPAYKDSCNALLSKPKLSPMQGKKDDPAHPAIYPTGNPPKGLKAETAKLYDLIVKRFLACFGNPAKRESTKITIDVEGELFIAEGKRTVEPGWHTIYAPYVKLNEMELPKTKKGDDVRYKGLDINEDETKPPKRYTQASLVKELSERNLGTKATRAQIVETLFKRGYVKGAPLEATTLGIEITSILEKQVPEIVDEELTRGFEEDMEGIRSGTLHEEQILNKAKKLLTKVLKDFKAKEKEVGEELKEANHAASSFGPCPVCKDGILTVRFSKQRKRFLACDKYPDCKTTFALPQQGTVYKADEPCKECGFPVVKIYNPGAKRTVLMCINPECSTNKSSKEGTECPKCKKGKLVVRTSRYGRFLACDRYPECKFTERL